MGMRINPDALIQTHLLEYLEYIDLNALVQRHKLNNLAGAIPPG